MWLQISIPVFTLAGGVVAGRFVKWLDRNRETREAQANRKPKFEVTALPSSRYRLQNIGDAAATGVWIDTAPYPRESLSKRPGEPFDLAVGQLVEFGIPTGDWEFTGGKVLQKPAAVVVRCAEIPEGVHVVIP